MTTKSNLAIASAALALLVVIWAAWPRSQGTERDLDGNRIVAAAATTPRERPVADAPPDPPGRSALTAPAPVVATTGSLRVRVRYADEPRPAPDVPVMLNRPGGDFRVDVLRARTDTAGMAQFDAVPAGNWEVSTGHALRPKQIEILAGQANECVLDLPRGVTLSGIVVDRVGTTIAGALVEVGVPRRRDPEVMAITGADGTFTLRGCTLPSLVGARAAGYASSSLLTVHGNEDAPQRVRIELVAPGGVVEGLVVDEQGATVADAVVRVGDGPTDNLSPQLPSCPPLPAQVRTDVDGRFRAIGVPAGTRPVQVRAVGFAPWRGTCEIVANLTVPMRVTLGAGARCAGTVVTGAGAPVADVTVQVGAKGDFVRLSARTAADGSFVLSDLPSGEVEVTAADETHGRASAKVTAAPGATAHCELCLSGQQLRGRVVDEADRPVAWNPVKVTVQGGEPRAELAMTDQEGRFRVFFLPDGCRVTIQLDGNAFGSVRKTDVDPAVGEVLVRVHNAPRSARVRGTVLDADGRPATDVTVMAPGDPAVVTGADGSFDIGPLRTGAARLYFEKDGYARYRTPTLTLTDNATVDLGMIRLHRGGTVRIEVSGAAADQLSFAAYDDRGEGVTGIWSTALPVRSTPLVPGSYELRAHGKGFAPQRLPFVIRDGEETALTVAVTPGTAQRFEFRLPAGDEAAERVAFDVRRGDALVWSATARTDRGFAVEASLAPGDYEVVVTQDGLHGSARFTVGRAPGPPVVVQVR